MIAGPNMGDYVLAKHDGLGQLATLKGDVGIITSARQR
jgi:hypothetical protein